MHVGCTMCSSVKWNSFENSKTYHVKVTIKLLHELEICTNKNSSLKKYTFEGPSHRSFQIVCSNYYNSTLLRWTQCERSTMFGVPTVWGEPKEHVAIEC